VDAAAGSQTPAEGIPVLTTRRRLPNCVKILDSDPKNNGTFCRFTEVTWAVSLSTPIFVGKGRAEMIDTLEFRQSHSR
jgi:hypothetical protein